MRSGFIAATLLLLTSCGSPAGSQDGNENRPTADRSGSSQVQGSNREHLSEWAVSQSTSGIDGDVLIATKMMQFRDRRTFFQAVVTCKVDARDAAISIISIVGDQQSPDPERSLFVAEVDEFRAGMHERAGLSMQMLGMELNPYVPVGRAKLGTGEVIPLASAFNIHSQSGNLLVLNTDFAISKAVPESSLFSDADPQSRPRRDEINSTAAQIHLLPIVAEVNNGAGTFEILIDSSNELRQVLAACGGEEDLLDESYHQRIAADAVEKQEALEAENERKRVAAQEKRDRDQQLCDMTGGRSCPGESTFKVAPTSTQSEPSRVGASSTADTAGYVDQDSFNMNLPNYPAEALKAGIEGVAIVEVEVSAEGEVLSVRIERSSRNRMLDNAALEAARRWKFHPSTRGGQPITSKVRVPVTFSLSE